MSGVPGFRSPFQSSPKASRLLRGPCNAVMSLAVLRSFLVLWKQLEVLKEHWGRLKLRGQDLDSVSLHKQFSELYRWALLRWKSPWMSGIWCLINSSPYAEGEIWSINLVRPAPLCTEEARRCVLSPVLYRKSWVLLTTGTVLCSTKQLIPLSISFT